MPTPTITVDRDAIVRFRLHTNGLNQRTKASPAALRAATRAGCQDSMPRAAIVSLHARLHGIDAAVLERPDLIQVWGPGFSAYVVAADDVPVFTLGRQPASGQRRQAAFEMAKALAPILAEGPITYRAAGNRLGVDPNRLRYAALTGTVALHWAGSGAPQISALPAPTVEPFDAALELGRRFLHIFGPATSDDFSKWAGVNKTHAATVFAALDDELTPVETPIGPAAMLATDRDTLEAVRAKPVEGVRLLPSGDAHYLVHGEQRTLLVDDIARISELWTSRVWPGAVLVNGAIVGTWRRSGPTMTIETWRQLVGSERAQVEAEARSLPLPEPVSTIVWSALV